jgi:hypothetical protein
VYAQGMTDMRKLCGVPSSNLPRGGRAAPTMVITKVFPCKWMVRADGGVAPRIWAHLAVHAAQYVQRDTAVEIEEVVRMQLGKISTTIRT